MKKRNTVLALAACAAFGFTFFGMQTLNVQASTEETPVDYGKYFVLDGAGIRAKANDNDYNGIRFDAILDGDIYSTLEEMETDSVTVDYGMIVAPMSYAETNPYTKNNLFGTSRKYYVDGVTEAGEGLIKLGGAHVETLKDAKDEKGNVIGKLIRGVIHNIPEAQITREFIGVPYICITTDGEAEFFVGEYQKTDARSMVYVAQLAYADEDNGLSADAHNYLYTYYLTKAADKSYTYTVEHIGITPTGEEVSLDKENGEKTKLGTTVTATAKTFEGYTFDDANSVTSDIIYANNRTALKLYYTQDHLDVTFVNDDSLQITPAEGGSEEYALRTQDTYDFTVTPPAGYNNQTQQIWVFVNDTRLYTDKEGNYSIALASYEDVDALDIKVGIGEYAATPITSSDPVYDAYADVEKVTEGEFSGAYKYSNYTGGQLDSEWGNSGLYFDEVYNPVLGAQNQTFFAKGFKYIKLQIYFTDSVASFNVRQGTGQSGTNSLEKVGFGAWKPTSSIVSFGDGKNVACEYLQKNMWYTMYIEPTKGNMITIYSNGGSVENPAVIYVKDISYETTKPTYTTTLGAHVQNNFDARANVYIGQAEFEGENVWKYVNRYDRRADGKAGLCFDELKSSDHANFFAAGYNYVKLDFYVTESVQKIDFKKDSANFGTQGSETYTMGTDFSSTFKTSSTWMFYDKDGNRVTKLAYNNWYTLWILATNETYSQMFIQASGTITEASAPTMYFKNISYQTEKPLIPTLTAYGANYASLISITETTFENEKVWEYVNLDGFRQSQAKQGVGFNELSRGNSAAFFGAGYQYVKLDFYITESVSQIDFKTDTNNSMNHSEWEQYTVGDNFHDSFKTSTTWMIYDEDGNRVTTKLEYNTWYTLWILATDVDYPQVLIQASGAVMETSAPTMYFKNISYQKTK